MDSSRAMCFIPRMKWIFIVLVTANLAAAQNFERLFLYRVVDDHQTEVLHLGNGRCVRYWQTATLRKEFGEWETHRSTSQKRLEGEPPLIDYDGQPVESAGFGLSLLEGDYQFKDSGAQWGDLQPVSSLGPLLEIACKKNALAEREYLRGTVDLNSYTAELYAPGEAVPQAWRVAHLVTKDAALMPFVRNFYSITAKGAVRQLLPKNANIRIFLTLLTGKEWFLDRKKLRHNRRGASAVREALQAMAVPDVMISEPDDFDAFGEVLVHLPQARLAALEAALKEHIEKIEPVGHWGHALMVQTPKWRLVDGRRLPMMCAHALIAPLEITRLDTEDKAVFARIFEKMALEEKKKDSR